jgi:hypothetical protein
MIRQSSAVRPYPWSWYCLSETSSTSCLSSAGCQFFTLHNSALWMDYGLYLFAMLLVSLILCRAITPTLLPSFTATVPTQSIYLSQSLHSTIRYVPCLSYLSPTPPRQIFCTISIIYSICKLPYYSTFHQLQWLSSTILFTLFQTFHLLAQFLSMHHLFEIS